jgi:hypothetical protein
MTGKPEAETLFEFFCGINRIRWRRVPTGQTRTPDYLGSLSGEAVYVEIKADRFRRTLPHPVGSQFQDGGLARPTEDR